MDRSKDLELHKMLKEWASASKPPENGRARLMWAVATASKKKSAISPKILKLHSDEHATMPSNNWSQKLFYAWVLEHRIQSGMTLHLC